MKDLGGHIPPSQTISQIKEYYLQWAHQVPRTRRNLLVVSTLDGQLTALDLARSGEMVWSH